MKKILFIHHGKGLGGAPLSLLYMIEGLDKTKFHPMVLFLYDSEVIELYRSRDIEVFGPICEHDFAHTKIWWYRAYHIHHLIKSIISTFKISLFVAKKWFGKLKPDIVHLNTSSLIAFGIVAKKQNIPVVWHIREPLAFGYFGIRKKIIKNIIEKNASVIVPISKNDSLPWRDSQKTKVIYNAVDANFFHLKERAGAIENFLHTHELSKVDPKILFLGGLSEQKGTLMILEIMQKVLTRLPNAKLLIAGYFDCELKKSLKYFLPSQKYKRLTLSAMKSIQRSVALIGPIDNVPTAMAASDVVVFPATVGHFARPVIEAGFMAKPTVATDLAPLNELIIDSKTGFLVELDDKLKFADIIIDLLLDKNLNNRIGSAARDYCLSKFGVMNQVVEIEKCYNQVLSN